MKTIFWITLFVCAFTVTIEARADGPSPLSELSLPDPAATNTAITNTTNMLPAKLKELAMPTTNESKSAIPAPPIPTLQTPKVVVAPEPPPLPPLQPLPPIPTEVVTKPTSVEQPPKEVAVVSAVPNKDIKATKKTRYHKPVKVILGKIVNYPKDHLVEAIYTKKYDQLSQHLPQALYERDLDNLVFITALQDNIEGLRAVLHRGRSIEMRNAQGDTPLLVAVRHNAINATRLLLALHANASAEDRNGLNALAIAKQNGNAIIQGAIEAASVTKTASRD